MDEYESLFMKHKADLGRCKLAEHGIELDPNVEPHREGARRMSPLKAAKANEEVRHLLALVDDSTFVLSVGKRYCNGA